MTGLMLASLAHEIPFQGTHRHGCRMARIAQLSHSTSAILLHERMVAPGIQTWWVFDLIEEI